MNKNLVLQPFPQLLFLAELLKEDPISLSKLIIASFILVNTRRHSILIINDRCTLHQETIHCL